MKTREPRVARPWAVACCALALSAGSVLPAAAAPSTYTYDALGDSYAAGAGVAAGGAYPFVLDGRMRISLDDFAAVPGATTASMMSQLGALDEDTDLVTISIGGNDIGWSNTILLCLVGTDAQCAMAVAATSATIATGLPILLDQAYTAVSAAAPNAHIVVTGYPRLFSPEYGAYNTTVSGYPVEASVVEQQLMNDGADLLNATIRTVAQEHGYQFVDVTGRYLDHGVNAPDAWVFGATDPVPFHPTADGQQAYGVALRAAIRPPDLR